MEEWHVELFLEGLINLIYTKYLCCDKYYFSDKCGDAIQRAQNKSYHNDDNGGDDDNDDDDDDVAKSTSTVIKGFLYKSNK